YQAFVLGAEELTVQAGGGDDAFHVHGLLPAPVFLLGETGNDSLVKPARTSAQPPGAVHPVDYGGGGGGNDGPITTAGQDDVVAINGLLQPGPAVQDITTRATGQLTAHVLTEHVGTLYLVTRGGNDFVNLDWDSDLLGGLHTAIIRGGAGDDTVIVHARGPISDRRRVEVHGGDGNDNVHIEFSETTLMPGVRLAIAVEGGAGKDNISVLANISARMGIEPTPFNPDLFTGISVDGGAGDDGISVLADITARMGVEPTPFRVNILTNVDVSGGSGADNIAVLAAIHARLGPQPTPFLPNVVT